MNREPLDLGTPEVTDRMAYGGTRYHFLHGVMIDHVEKEGLFYVAQGQCRRDGASTLFGKVPTLEEALTLAKTHALTYSECLALRSAELV